MPASFTVSDDGTYLLERVMGQHSAAMQRPVINELFSMIATTSVTRTLVDARQQHTPIGTMEVYRLWEELAPRVPRGAKFAVVVGWAITGRPFIETVAINRGVNIRYFNDMDEAVAWLIGSDESTLTS